MVQHKGALKITVRLTEPVTQRHTMWLYWDKVPSVRSTTAESHHSRKHNGILGAGERSQLFMGPGFQFGIWNVLELDTGEACSVLNVCHNIQLRIYYGKVKKCPPWLHGFEHSIPSKWCVFEKVWDPLGSKDSLKRMRHSGWGLRFIAWSNILFCLQVHQDVNKQPQASTATTSSCSCNHTPQTTSHHKSFLLYVASCQIFAHSN